MAITDLDAYGGLLTAAEVDALWTFSGGSNVTLRTQSEVLSQIETLLMDTGNDRWTDAYIYAAMNLALGEWQRRVMIPFAHTIAGGWVAGTYEYSLASFIEGPITPQQKHHINDYYFQTGVSDNSLTWADIVEFTVEPTSTGGRVLRFDFQPYEDAGRVLWWGHNGPLPTALPVTSATIDADDDEIILTTKPQIGRSGYIKIESEWLAYFGYEEDSTTLTLTNVARGLNHTTAASHSAGATVTWGIAIDDNSLVRQLIDQTRAHLMEMWLSNPSSREVAHYEKQMVFFQQRADMFWRRYTSKRPTKFTLSRRAIGPVNRGKWYTP